MDRHPGRKGVDVGDEPRYPTRVKPFVDRCRRLSRLVARLAGPSLLLGLLPPWLILGFVVTQTLGILPWPQIAAWTSSFSPLRSAALVTVAVGAWAWATGPVMARATRSPALAFAWRAPVEDAAWGFALGPWWLLAGLPIALVGAFARGPAWPIEPVALLAVWPVVAGAAARPGRLAVALIALFGVVVTARQAPAVWGLVALAAPLWALAAVRLARTRPAVGSRPAPAPRPRSPLAALIRHDLLGVVRDERPRLWLLLLPAPVIALAATRLAGTPEVGMGVALGLLGLSAPLAASPLARLVARLGARLDPPSWPVSALLRVASLGVVFALSASPAWGAAAATAPSPVDALRATALVAALAAGAVACATRRRLELGWFVAWDAAVTVTSWLPSPSGWLADVGLAGLAFGAGAWALARRRGHA